MISSELRRAREYEARECLRVKDDERPVYHFSPRIGWLNDPNGFAYYGGMYHLFYQYHPYSTYWGPMHWGHAVSRDLITWEYMPAALAPDTEYDGAGCFSGSAITLHDGRMLLMYTGCSPYGRDETGRWRQTQCIAVGDGYEFTKIPGNPVLSDNDLPEDGDAYEFRDPYIWEGSDGIYRSLIANASRSERSSAQLTVYRSRDAFNWERSNVLFEDFLRIGVMWECPNLFELDGQHILVASPMDMEAEEADGSIRFPKGNNVCYILGSYDERSDHFIPYRAENSEYASYHPVDCGLDFYAPQIRKMPDGRYIMIGWMQDPEMANLHDDDKFNIFCQMTAPRELSLKDGRLIQTPVRELDDYRRDKISVHDVPLDICEDEGGIRLSGVEGRVLDLSIAVRPETVTGAGACSMDEFCLRFAEDEEHYVRLSYRPDSSVVTVDRSCSGQADNITKRRSIRVRDRNGSIDLRILLDRYSAEVFVNGGEQTITLTYYTPLTADGISFCADGRARMDIESYTLDNKIR